MFGLRVNKDSTVKTRQKFLKKTLCGTVRNYEMGVTLHLTLSLGPRDYTINNKKKIILYYIIQLKKHPEYEYIDLRDLTDLC